MIFNICSSYPSSRTMMSMANELPLLLGAAAVFMLMGKKGDGNADDSGNGNGNGDGNGDDTGDDPGNGGGVHTSIGGLASSAGSGDPTMIVMRQVPFSSLGMYSNGLGTQSNCARLMFLPKKVGDTYEIKGWPAGTYGVEAAGGTDTLDARDVLEAKAVGGSLYVTLRAGTAVPPKFYVKFRGGQSAFGSDILRYVFFSGVRQDDSWNCPAELKQ
jgi:hypothetical protein